jgi:outer membrane protein insertion porin family/translocation and assembly module TamA
VTSTWPGRLPLRLLRLLRLLHLLRLMAAVLAAALALVFPWAAAGAQDVRCEAGDREVRALRFAGNRAFTDAELAQVVVTTPSSVFSRLRLLGVRRCLDPDEFPRDLLRLQAYYRKRGYPAAAVDTLVEPVADRAVAVTFRVSEGRPLRIDSVAVTGLDGVRGADAVVRAFSVRPGSVFDRVALEAALDSIRVRLRDRGYPAADALFNWNTDTARLAATATIAVIPGPFTRVGRVRVQLDTSAGSQRIPERVVRRTLALRSGDPFDARAIVDAQRALYQTDAYRRVEIRADTGGVRVPNAQGGADSVAHLVVSLAEGDLNVARVAAGWATLDCFRTGADFTDRYFQPWAQRIELTARLSRIGIGDPLGGAPGLCPQARQDVYSDRLNYYVGATLRQPTLFGLRRVPSLTLFTARASEFNAFRRTTNVGALFSLASRTGTRLPSTFSYQLERGRTEANFAVLCAVFSACDDGERARVTSSRTLGAVGYSLVRNRADDPLTPSRGAVQRLTYRHSSAVTGSHPSQRFDKLVVDASWYRPLTGGAQLIAHVQAGALLGGAPPQERLFGGGPTTVRGFRQNELGPVVYLVSRFDTLRVPRSDTVFFLADPEEVGAPDRAIPVGGNTLVVGNLELQLRSPVVPELLALALFTDAGNVWDRGVETADYRGLRVTPGAGVRIRSPFGAIRIDLGYNPYRAIGGAAYYISERVRLADGTSLQQLYCVTPGNGLPVYPIAGRGGLPEQTPGTCSADFRPAASRSFLQRLNPSIWIGSAF